MSDDTGRGRDEARGPWIVWSNYGAFEGWQPRSYTHEATMIHEIETGEAHHGLPFVVTCRRALAVSRPPIAAPPEEHEAPGSPPGHQIISNAGKASGA